MLNLNPDQNLKDALALFLLQNRLSGIVAFITALEERLVDPSRNETEIINKELQRLEYVLSEPDTNSYENTVESLEYLISLAKGLGLDTPALDILSQRKHSIEQDIVARINDDVSNTLLIDVLVILLARQSEESGGVVSATE